MAAQQSIRVLFLSSCVHGGGAGHSLTSILANVDERFEAHVVMPEPGVIAARFPSSVRIHYIPEFVERLRRSPYAWPDLFKSSWLHFIINMCIAPYAALRIMRLARKLNIQVIHCNHMWAKPFGVVVGAWLKIPVVFHVRNTHHLKIDRMFYDWLGARQTVKKIICNSNRSAEAYQRRNAKKITIVPNGIDLEQYKPGMVTPCLRQKYNLPKDCFVIGYVGRILPKKGLDWLIRSFSRFAQKQNNVFLAIVGDNDQGPLIDMKKRYRRLSAQQGVADQVIFTGFQDDVRPYVSDFDALVFPSIQPESFGRVLLEAMSLKIPAISSELGGAIEVIEHNKQGLLVKVSDMEQLCEAFDNLYLHPDLRQAMGESGRKRVESLYGNDAMAQRVFEVITQCATD